MKKAYDKPMILIEKFELSQSIAACAWDVNLVSEEVCGAVADKESNWGGVTIFNEKPLCNADPTLFEDFCYTSSGDGWNTFNS